MDLRNVQYTDSINLDLSLLTAQEVSVSSISPMAGTLPQTPFDPSFTQSHLMKLFPGPGMSSTTQASSTNIFRTTNTPGSLHPGPVPQNYPAEFSNYGPMYSSYSMYAKQAQAMANANNPSSR